MLEMTTPTFEKTTDNLLHSPYVPAQHGVGTLVSYSVPWPKVSLMAFLRFAANSPRIYWENNNVSIGFAGCGIAAALTAHGPDRFQALQREADRLFDNLIVLDSDVPSAIGPRLFGGFSFRTNHEPDGLWAAFPPAHFILPRYQLTRFEDQVWLTINRRVEPEDDPMSITWLLHDEAENLRRAAMNFVTGNGSIELVSGPEQSGLQAKFDDLMEQTTWHRLVSDAVQRIRQGELDKVVLARARKLRSAVPIDPANVLIQLNSNYPNCYRFLFEPVPGHAFYGATPELLAEVSGSRLRTIALAGSIRRGKSTEEDDALGQELLATPKERHEHAFVVEAIEENLRPLVSNLRIAPQPGLCRLSNIQHIQTVIEAELANGRDILPIIEALHPTPALGGRPRRIALDLINQVEPISRGWYGSPIGWLDHQGNGMFAVAIRSAVSVDDESMLFAGAGIVADSEPDKEWRETQLKFMPLMDALRGAHSR